MFLRTPTAKKKRSKSDNNLLIHYADDIPDSVSSTHSLSGSGVLHDSTSDFGSLNDKPRWQLGSPIATSPLAQDSNSFFSSDFDLSNDFDDVDAGLQFRPRSIDQHIEYNFKSSQVSDCTKHVVFGGAESASSPLRKHLPQNADLDKDGFPKHTILKHLADESRTRHSSDSVFHPNSNFQSHPESFSNVSRHIRVSRAKSEVHQKPLGIRAQTKQTIFTADKFLQSLRDELPRINGYVEQTSQCVIDTSKHLCTVMGESCDDNTTVEPFTIVKAVNTLGQASESISQFIKSNDFTQTWANLAAATNNLANSTDKAVRYAHVGLVSVLPVFCIFLILLCKRLINSAANDISCTFILRLSSGLLNFGFDIILVLLCIGEFSVIFIVLYHLYDLFSNAFGRRS